MRIFFLFDIRVSLWTSSKDLLDLSADCFTDV